VICGPQQIFWASNNGQRDEWDEDGLGDKRHFIQFFGGKSEGLSQLEDLRPTFGCHIAMVMALYWINLVMIGTSVSLL